MQATHLDGLREIRHHSSYLRYLAVLIAFLLVVAGEGCKSARFSELSEKPPGPNSPASFLQEGDLLSITFQFATNFNVVQKIPLDGFLNLESVGLVKAAGKTPLDLQAELSQLYRPQIKDDVVTVKPLAAATAVYVAGAVFHPGRIPMERPMTALEAVMEAGGFDPNRARLSAVTVVRIQAGHQKLFHLDLTRVLHGLDEAPFYLKPFDIVHVPTKTFNF